MLPIGIEGYQANSALKEFHVGSSNIVSTSNGVVVFDPRVDNLSLLLAGLRPGLQAHVLERDRDGVQQIADLLQDHPTDSLILVTHGFPGGMQLGSATLEHSNLYRYGAQIQKWFEKSRSPQLTLLACHVAAGDVGKAFISQLCEWTGATLIATAALVGNGDWPQTADSLFDTAVLKSYTATLEIGFETFLRDGVDGIEGLAGVNSVAVSPDGRHVFVTAEAISGRRTGTLAVFDRNLTSGRLTINAIFDESIDDVDGLSGVSAVTTSPDGRQVFVTSSLDRALTVFDRDPVSGQLTLNSIIQNSSTSGPFITGISAIAASPDGRQLFVTGYSNDSLAVFDRDPISGAWALTREFNDDAEGIDGLRQATSVAISRDGRQVFVAGTRDNALAVFDRNPESGEVSFRTIFRDDSLNLIDIDTEGLDGLYQARFVTTSPDDKQVFVVSEFENALAVFDRDASSGDLTFRGVFRDTFNGVDGLDGARAIATSPDGAQVFVLGGFDDALAVFNRDSSSGNLTFRGHFKDNTNGVNGLDWPRSIVVSPDGGQVFVTGFSDDAVAVFNTQGNGEGFILPPSSPADGVLTPVADNRALEITRLSNTSTLSLDVAQVGITGVGEVRVLSTVGLGGGPTQLANFSLLEGNQLPADYAPSFTLTRASISEGIPLQFELIQDGSRRTATVATDSAGQIVLDFGEGTLLNALLATETSTTNLLMDDAAAIDLSDQTGPIGVQFTVFREADYDNTVGFYRIENAEGIVTDPISGATLRPGDDGYKAAAIAQRIDVNLTGQNGQVSTFEAQLTGGEFLGIYLIADGSDPIASEVYFAHAGANSGGNDHAKLLGSNIFGFEDLAGLGDRDFNDFVVKFEVV